jgi:acyl-CoA synthetase (NDP forming)
VPAASVPTTAEECGRAGVRAFLVVTAGLDAEQARALMAACRAYGMRLVGPNCLGISNTDPDLRLDATFAAVDATAAVTEEQLGECVDGLMRYGGVDAVLVALVPTAVGTATGDDLVRGLTGATVRRTRPIAVVRLEQDVPVTLLPAADGGTIPSYAEPHAVARALTHAARRASWLARPVGTVPELDGVDAERAHEIAGTYLAAQPEGGWPDPRTCAELLDCYGIPQIPWAWAESEDDAVLAARRLRGIDGVVAVVDELSWRMDDTHLRPDRQALHGAADDWLREM